MSSAVLPRTFIWRRIHSLAGLWLVLFLMEHLLVNSQAALLLGDHGKGFVSLVNGIHNFPYLQGIEIALLGFPILFHMVLGVKYLLTSKSNSSKTDGSTPSLPEYKRNKAYTWQRITSWILLFLLAAHVVKFRFIQYPKDAPLNYSTVYMVKVSIDPGLYSVGDRMGVVLIDQEGIENKLAQFQIGQDEDAVERADRMISKQEIGVFGPEAVPLNKRQQSIFIDANRSMDDKKFMSVLKSYSLKPGQVVAVAPDFGTASLISVRDTFKNPIYLVLYTIFVLAACFHAFNGFWTFLLSWGMIIKVAAQKSMRRFSIGLMLLIAFLGLVAIWGTYWINLKS